MVDIKTELVKGYKGIDIPIKTLSKNLNSKSLAIILPGAGYTSQAPLLHYSTGVFLNKSFDILQVNYNYNHEEYKDFSEISEAIKTDVSKVLDYFLSNKSYNNFYMIGKSLGTIAMSSELNKKVFKNAKAIWLTPLIQIEDVLNAMVKSENKGLMIIGDKDPCYTEERYLTIEENSNITPMLIPNVNHRLEYDDKPIESIEILKEALKKIDQFY
ncbi:alpha/beta hydrolase [Halalkalibacillus sediminis]|uniref:Alpha/beta hydrolase n=1 Tax=Halalkalibacillus sediminis TaxID=2018042 RepID=A0A2I0QR54_9BACI|nr:alpha/beta hydrolase [Halalkalibacillus sediminis]PKR76816.1 alpha/beta hydrolase [Halalkalibacillus sediminis]